MCRFAGNSRGMRVFFSRFMRENLAHPAKTQENDAKKGRKTWVLQF
jgi:hypothetical protein